MVVRLRFQKTKPKKENVVEMRPRAAEREVVTTQEIAAGAASLLWPVTSMVFALAVWRLGQDLGLTASFFIQDGPMSHWQPWLAMAMVLGAGCGWLSKRGRASD